ncbi:MAG: glycosyltransferase family 1 protein [Phycisphaerales bacterium]|nr:MAG: glycosyltransferase family 1 protein [Phycisphaerales bacterium]
MCWIQGQLPNLTSRQAGKSIGPLDFYIAPEVDQFIRHYSYPPKQGMRWSAATDHRLYDARPLSDEELAPFRCDISFVSNQSKLPRVYHEERLRLLPDDPDVHRLTDYLFEAIETEITERPETAGVRSAASILRQAERELGLAPATTDVADTIARFYIHPMTELMYRQATLEWVADYCDRGGHTLHLYGNGWEPHPRFSKWARGFAENGEQLRAIHQASAINLQSTSYGAVHQRLLDGLAAGGFFLIRYCPTDIIHGPTRRLLDVIEQYGVIPGVTYDAKSIPAPTDAWGALQKHQGEPWDDGPVFIYPEELDRLRSLAAEDYRLMAGAVFKRYHDVCFRSAREFANLADRYLGDADTRREIADSMRASVVERFTHDAFARDLLAFIAKRLSERDEGRP